MYFFATKSFAAFQQAIVLPLLLSFNHKQIWSNRIEFKHLIVAWNDQLSPDLLS